MEAFVGTILPWPLTWAPQGWFLCQGQQLPIAQYQALFALLAFTYGGDQQTKFGLPDLRSRLPLGAGAGTGLTSRTVAQVGGSETAAVTLNNLPPHAHPATFTPNSGGVVALQVSTAQGNTTSAAGNYLANAYYPGDAIGASPATLPTYVTPASAGVLENVAGSSGSGLGGTVTVGATGTGAPLDTMPPFLVLNYIICWDGLYPNKP